MMLDSIQQKLQSLDDNIAASKQLNVDLSSKLRCLQEKKANLIAQVDQVAITCEELDKSIKEEATQVSALEWEQRAHRNAVKVRKQKIVSLRALDAKDLAHTTSERKMAQVTLDSANIRMIKAIPGLSTISILDGEEVTDEECDAETKALQEQNHTITGELKRKRAEHGEESANQTKQLAAMISAHAQLKSDCDAAAENLGIVKNRHTTNAKYIASTEATIVEINREIDSDSFMEREKSLSEMQAKWQHVPKEIQDQILEAHEQQPQQQDSQQDSQQPSAQLQDTQLKQPEPSQPQQIRDKEENGEA